MSLQGSRSLLLRNGNQGPRSSGVSGWGWYFCKYLALCWLTASGSMKMGSLGLNTVWAWGRYNLELSCFSGIFLWRNISLCKVRIERHRQTDRHTTQESEDKTSQTDTFLCPKPPPSPPGDLNCTSSHCSVLVERTPRRIWVQLLTPRKNWTDSNARN